MKCKQYDKETGIYDTKRPLKVLNQTQFVSIILFCEILRVGISSILTSGFNRCYFSLIVLVYLKAILTVDFTRILLFLCHTGLPSPRSQSIKRVQGIIFSVVSELGHEGGGKRCLGGKKILFMREGGKKCVYVWGCYPLRKMVRSSSRKQPRAIVPFFVRHVEYAV